MWRRLTDEPDPRPPTLHNIDLAGLQMHQWQQNSFEPEEESSPSLDGSRTPEVCQEPEPESEPPKLDDPGSKWVHLFYDLAWAASFASLTGNGKFDNPLDTVNYFIFFTAVLWMWTSQLFIYGMLAATTQGYDVTTYIGHSPGELILIPPSNDPPTPERYAAEKKAYLSILALAIAFTATRQVVLISSSNGGKLISARLGRVIHLIQYLRVILYGTWAESAHIDIKTTNWRSIPSRLKAVTIGLVISNLMFIAALVIAAKDFGESVLGASLKLGLWIGGFFVEFLSHSRLVSSGSSLPTNPDVNLYERLQTITVIILGEGINGIATTLARVLAAPGAGKTMGGNIISAACTIWCIAYIYFQGPKERSSPAFTSARYFPWLMFHFPFLASIVLLLIGMKHQFLVTGFLSSLFKTVDTFNNQTWSLIDINSNVTEWRNMSNPKMERFLIKRGFVWQGEVQKLLDTLQNTTADGQPIDPTLALDVWIQRFSLSVVVKLFKSFSPDQDVLDNLQQRIADYYQNLEQVIQDVNYILYIPEPDLSKAEYYKILSQLLDGPVLNTRCIVGFAGLLLISLSLIDFVHSRPRDRYECGVLISRFLMGLSLCLLLLLNVGAYQKLFVPVNKLNRRAGVFRWLEAYEFRVSRLDWDVITYSVISFWVLPTIAIAYGVQFLIEIVLARFAKRARRKAQEQLVREREQTRPKWRKS
ncbi:unnamed protein product [Rhizoctonia solani]|uniref:Uncharacterized protein n=1 Tax=Rhizoctonia solani TaxID=456999 RepID=A0A8H3B177_9AGAM|nr:unnamed protein product [Rhizoctonia solani]